MPNRFMSAAASKTTLLRRPKRIWLALTIIVSLIASFRWLNFKIFAFSDWLFSFAETNRELLIPSIWNSMFNLGFSDPLIWRWPLYMLYGLFGVMNLSANVAEKFVYFWPAAVLPAVAAFLLVREIFKSDPAAFVGALVFAFNTYFLAINSQGHVLLTVASALGALSLWCVMRTLKTGSFKYVVAAALSFLGTAAYDLRVLYITAWVVLFYLIYHFALEAFPRSFSELLKKTKLLFALGVLTALFNFYWMYSSFTAGSFSETEYLVRDLFGDEFWGLTKAVTLHHPFWTGGFPEWFKNHPIPWYFWCVPLAAFLGFVTNIKHKAVWFFAAIAALGIFLTKQAGWPFPDVYPWLFEHLPGFSAFREASKFYFLIALGYAVLIGGFVAWLWKDGRPRFLRLPLTALIALLFLWNTKPLLTGAFGSLYEPRAIPKDYLIFKEFIEKQPDYFKVFWTPRDSRWGFYSITHPKVSNVDKLESTWQKLLDYSRDFSSSAFNEQIAAILKQPFSDALLDLSSAKYVVIPLDDKKNSDDYFAYYGDRQYYLNLVGSLPFLHKIDIGTESLAVYENKNFMPNVYALTNLFGFDSLDNLDSKTQFAQATAQGFTFTLLNEKQNREPLRVVKDETFLSGFERSERNLIPNASFENGLWEERPRDCHPYDDRPEISMKLDTAERSDGANSLLLEAKRHNACTVRILAPLKGGSEYWFKFDYQSPTRSEPGFYLAFNGGTPAFISRRIKLKDTAWHTYSAKITVPPEATAATLYIYAFNTKEGVVASNRYDNFLFEKVSGTETNLFVPESSGIPMEQPAQVQYTIVNQALRTVTVEGARTPFFLSLSESFHPKWGLTVKKGFAARRVAPENHYSLNNLYNTWYIDTNEYCEKEHLCTKQADGTYNLELRAEFMPQRDLIVGVVVSGSSILAALAWALRSRKKAVTKRSPSRLKKVDGISV